MSQISRMMPGRKTWPLRFDEDKPAIRSAAITIVRQWINEK